MPKMTTRRAFTTALVLSFLASSGPAAAAPHRNASVMAAVESNHQFTLDLWKSIVDIDSGTGNVEGGNKVDAIVAATLKSLGAEITSKTAEAPGLPDNLLAVFHGTGRAKILIVAHIDTVFPAGTAAARPFAIDGERAHGPGVGDEKAGVVCAVVTLKILHDLRFKNYATITLLLDDSEELGSPGATELIKTLARQHDVEFNMEPGDPLDAITVWRKGSGNIRIDVQGRAAHAGMAPQDGRNAAVELVHQLSAIEGQFPVSGSGTTVNLTVLKSGDRTNIIPDFAEGTLNVRYRSAADFDAVLKRVTDNSQQTTVPGTHISVLHDPAFPPLTENPQIDVLAERARAIYAELGKTLAFAGNGGASESALAMNEGTPALDGLGFVGGDFHTDHEWVALNSVSPRLYLFTRLLMQTSVPP